MSRFGGEEVGVDGVGAGLHALSASGWSPGAWIPTLSAFLGRMTWPEALGYVGVVFSISASTMRTMIPLRCANLATNCVFISYGLLAGVYPTLIAHVVLLPINASRLVQMVRLVRKVRRAAASDLSMDWLKPFMNRRAVGPGAILFRRGDAADGLFYTLTGRYRLRELDVELAAGCVIGEMGLLAPDNRRTQTLECVEGGDVLSISYDQVRELYFQNPEFGFYLLKLTSGRLFENLGNLEREVAALRAGGKDAPGGGARAA